MGTWPPPRRQPWVCGLGLLLCAAGCATAPGPAPYAPATAPTAAAPIPDSYPEARPGALGRVAGAHASLLVYVAAEGDSFSAIAQRFVGDASHARQLAQANGAAAPQAGQVLLVPLSPPSPWGVSGLGVQTVPVLCYHRFAAGAAGALSGSSKMLMPAAQFEAQLEWLAREGFRVLRLAELQAFLKGQQLPPPHSVVITVDDGWESFYRHAFPLLQKHRVPATLFVTTDLIGSREGLSWAQLREMAQSGLVDIQAHTKSHRHLSDRLPGESDTAWQRNLATELRQPRQLLERQLADVGVKVQHLAYPFGDVSEAVLSALANEPYALAFTVRAGGNAFYAAPHLLRRTMIFGDHTLADFAQRVQVRRDLNQP